MAIEHEINIKVRVRMSFWDALKLRIAGLQNTAKNLKSIDRDEKIKREAKRSR